MQRYYSVSYFSMKVNIFFPALIISEDPFPGDAEGEEQSAAAC